MGVPRGYLTVYTGGMFASKSTALLRQGQRHMLAGNEVYYIKPTFDARYSRDEIVTHDGQNVGATKINAECGIIDLDGVWDADVVLIDEAQFFTDGLVDDIKELINFKKTVYVAGLDMDWKQEPFEVMSKLMGLAHKVEKYQAVCSECGSDGYVTAKVSNSNERLELGKEDIYFPVCLECFLDMEGSDADF